MSETSGIRADRLLSALVVISVTVFILAINTGDESKAPWFVSRSAGITAYLLLSLSTVTGLLTSSGYFFRWQTPAAMVELHKAFSFIGIACVLLHGFGLLADRVVTYSIWQVSVPLLSSYRPFYVGAGIIAGYLMVILAVSFYIKKQIGGPKVWRAIHYGGFVAYSLGTLHGIMSGTDSGTVWMLSLYVTSGVVVLFLTYLRILGATRPQHQD